MKKIKLINIGNTLTTVVFMLTFITFSLTLTITIVSVYLNLAEKKIKRNSDFDKHFEILKKILPEMGLNIRDDFTSPFSGYFKELKTDIDGFKLTYTPLDSKFDINNLNVSLFFKINENVKSYSKNDIFIKKIDKFLFYPEDLKEYINPDIYENVKDFFSIYNVPAVNTADMGRVKMYMECLGLEKGLIEGITGKITSYRQGLNYLKYKGTNSKQSGLLLDRIAYENLKGYNWPEEINFFTYFDHNGMVNINFVEEKVFEVLIRGCGSKNVNYKDYWDIIKAKRDSEETIKENDLKNIFKSDWLCFEKMFSVDSRVFLITITRDNKVLSCIVRRYKEREMKFKVLKISVKYEEKEIKKQEIDGNKY